MARIEWNDNLSVGIESIDKQHIKLINLINNLYDAMSEGKGSQIIELILKEMIDYTDYHFNYEEKLFDKCNYQNTKEHILEHEKFKDQVSDFYVKFQSGNKYFSINLVNFLTDWLKNHIMISDKKYAPYIND